MPTCREGNKKQQMMILFFGRLVHFCLYSLEKCTFPLTPVEPNWYFWAHIESVLPTGEIGSMFFLPRQYFFVYMKFPFFSLLDQLSSIDFKTSLSDSLQWEKKRFILTLSSLVTSIQVNRHRLVIWSTNVVVLTNVPSKNSKKKQLKYVLILWIT